MPWNTAGNIKGPKGDKGDPGNAADIAALIHAATAKAPADADELPILDSGASWELRKLTFSNLKAALQDQFFYRGNIVGPVSQSGGIPTGAILQRGSNSNGEFVRYADGRQECMLQANISSSSVASNAEINIAGWSFPAAFITTPIFVDAIPYGAGSTSFIARLANKTASSSGTVNIKNLSNSPINLPTVLQLIAIGRWY